MSPEIYILRAYLKMKGLKQTPQREMILETSLQCGGHILIDKLFEKVKKKEPSIGIATIYRVVNIFK